MPPMYLKNIYALKYQISTKFRVSRNVDIVNYSTNAKLQKT